MHVPISDDELKPIQQEVLRLLSEITSVQIVGGDVSSEMLLKEIKSILQSFRGSQLMFCQAVGIAKDRRSSRQHAPKRVRAAPWDFGVDSL